jgi:hypothetical protein
MLWTQFSAILTNFLRKNSDRIENKGHGQFLANNIFWVKIDIFRRKYIKIHNIDPSPPRKKHARNYKWLVLYMYLQSYIQQQEKHDCLCSLSSCKSFPTDHKKVSRNCELGSATASFRNIGLAKEDSPLKNKKKGRCYFLRQRKKMNNSPIL